MVWLDRLSHLLHGTCFSQGLISWQYTASDQETAIDLVTFPSLSVAAAPSSPQAHTTIALEQTRKVKDYFVMGLALFPDFHTPHFHSLKKAGSVSASYPSMVRAEDH